tara:strand:+ start:172 stop:390 length:219 start_codon:yes stop_codon:yes gene_type:complete
MRITFKRLFDLAPDGVCKYSEFLQDIVVSYTTVSPLPEGGLFSVALSITCENRPHLAKEHPILRCPDFPLWG